MKQKDKILKAFSEMGNVLTPHDLLMLGIAQYNARIKELRDVGYNIENVNLGMVNGVKHTRFILKGKTVAKKSNRTIYEIARDNKEKINKIKKNINPTLI